MKFFKKLIKDKEKGNSQSITIIQKRSHKILNIEKNKIYRHSDKNPLILILIRNSGVKKYSKRNIYLHNFRYRNQ